MDGEGLRTPGLLTPAGLLPDGACADAATCVEPTWAGGPGLSWRAPTPLADGLWTTGRAAAPTDIAEELTGLGVRKSLADLEVRNAVGAAESTVGVPRVLPERTERCDGDTRAPPAPICCAVVVRVPPAMRSPMTGASAVCRVARDLPSYRTGAPNRVAWGLWCHCAAAAISCSGTDRGATACPGGRQPFRGGHPPRSPSQLA
mmetsp:Transcript_31787/g.79946  ORF Transcript_31787/g.79946 Transcript_31787/m.79946 type:complete len:203 (+) Transcript_31787:427-1035(+)